MLSRISGSLPCCGGWRARAVRGENYFKADIETGRVGAEQAAPRREFD